MAFAILKHLPSVRRELFPLRYCVKMIPTIHSKRHSSNGSFLTTAQAIHTMKSLMHNFKGGPNLVKDGEPEYSTLRQDSTPSPITSAALRKLSLTPYMHAINLERESIAYSTLQSWSPHISNLTAKTTGPPHNETGPPLTSICRPMMKSADSKSLLALAKALLSLQRATQSRHALRRENLYMVLRSSFRTALIKTLGEKTTLSYGEEDDMSEEKDSELMKIALQEENRDRCFLTLAENLKAPYGCLKAESSSPGRRE